MVQFHVLRCSSCQSFQVQQVKKVNKWSCKLCGEKQSLLKEFGRGSGADCRRHVQKLNAMRGAVMEEEEHNAWSLWKQVEADRQDVPEEHDQVRQTGSNTGSSRWSKYLDTPEEEEEEPEEEEDEENVLMDRQQLHGNNMIDMKRKRMKGRKPVLTTSLRNKSPPSENHTRTFNHTSPQENHTGTFNHTSPPSENHTRTFNHTSPPRKKSVNPPSVSSDPVSRWACFLRSDCQEEGEEGEEPSVSGRSQPVGGAASLSCGDIISQASSRPVSSMFDSGEDFSLDF